MALQHLRSSTANKRPTPTSMADGQVALNTAAVSPGVFFKDAGGSLVKVGPVHVGTTAPNVSPAVGGHAGNSVGEQWLDTTGGTYVFKVWDGSAWRSETGTFVDVNGDVMTGALGIIAGTAGAPGLYISGDTNTGIYSPGADQVAISTAGTGRLFVDASGNVGLNTSAPGFFFDVNTGAANEVAAGFRTNATGSAISFRDSTTTSTARPQIGAIGNDLVVKTGNTPQERMRLDSSGRLGLGTSSPQAILSITPSSSLSTTWDNWAGDAITFDAVNSTAGTGNYGPGISWKRNGSGVTRAAAISSVQTDADADVLGLAFFTHGSTDNTQPIVERLRITGAGNVGIGTTSPSAPLEVTSAAVNGVASEGIRIHMPGSFGGGLSGNSLLFTAQDSGSSNVIYSSIASLISSNTAGSHAGILTFNTVLGGTNTERARITSAGRLGIGTASPGATLHVAGECVLGDNGTNGRLTVNTTTSTVGLFATTTGFGAYEDLELRGAVTIFKRDGTNESARIDSSGRLLVGTSTARANLQGASRTARIQLEAASSAVITAADGATISALGGSTDAGVCAKLSLGRYASNTLGDTTLVSSDDFLGVVSFVGADGTNFIPGASIVARVDGTPGANDMPGRLVFSTTADGASSPTERMRITNAGKVIINDTSAVLGAPLSSVAQASVSAAAFRSDASTTFAVLTLWGNETSGDQLFVRLSTDSNTLRGSISYNRGGGVVAYNTTSDYRSKTILGNIENTGATIDAFKVYRGVMNGATIERPMMIAHEAQVAAPYCVTGEKDAVDDNGNPIYQQMDHQVLVPLLIAEIQQLRNRVAALEAS